MNEIMNWLGDVYYREVTDTVHETGYTSTWVYNGSSYGAQRLPFDTTRTETRVVLNWQAVSSTLFIVLTFITVVTIFRRAILK